MQIIVEDAEVLERVESLLSSPVVMTGFWLGEQLSVAHVRTDDRPALSFPSLGPKRAPLRPVDPAIRAIERPLFEEGIILWRFRHASSTGQEEVVVAATDVERARTVLAPIFGDTLRVRKSFWSGADIGDLDATIERIEPSRVESVEARVSPQGEVSRHLQLTFVDRDVAVALNKFPEGMLSVSALVRPQS